MKILGFEQHFSSPWKSAAVSCPNPTTASASSAILTGILVATLIPVALSLLVSRTLTKPLSSRPSSELEVESDKEEGSEMDVKKLLL